MSLRTNRDPGHGGSKTAVLAIILISYLMLLLDVSIVITGLPRIQHELGLSSTSLSWVQNAYTLAFGGLLLLGARAGDILGKKRMFLVGMGIFTVASLVTGAAPSALWILLGRAMQGVGAAILAPATLSLLQASFEEGPERTRAIAYYGATAGIGASVGLVLGGILADWLTWRAGFFINLPIGIALAVATMRLIAETPRHTGRFDLLGAATSTLGMTSLVYGIVRSATHGVSEPLTATALAAGALLLALFVWVESRAEQPVLPLRLFSNPERNAANAARFLFLGGMVGFWFLTTQLMQSVMGFTPFEAGIAFLPTTIPNFAMALAVPELTRRFGNARLLAASLAISVVGMAWLSRVTPATPYFTGIALPMILIGIGQGGTLSPLTVAGVAGVSERDAGAASGLVNAAHQLGGSVGLAALVVVMTWAGRGASNQVISVAHGVAASYAVGTVMLAVALVLVLGSMVRPTRRAVVAVDESAAFSEGAA